MRDEILALSADPQGFYAALGVAPQADAAALKHGYRQKAKLLHPDFNPSRQATQEFQRLTEAWRVLRDPRARARYDDAAASLALSVPWGATEDVVAPETPVPPLPCCCCGRISAQPRYLVFQRVESRLLRSRRRLIRGVFCRDCADRTAVRASRASWIGGWWGWAGPVLTLRALLANLRGGEQPRQANLWLLLHQGRAFLGRGETAIARSLAEQAAAFVADDDELRRATRLAAAAGDPPRRLRNCWRRRRRATLLQSLPLAALSLALGLGLAAALPTMCAQPPPEGGRGEIALRPAGAGETRHVAVDVLKVRQGPAASQPLAGLLDRFTTVEVMESVGDGEWVRILATSGLTGYVPARLLFGGNGDGAKSRWCAEQRGEPPRNGDLLLRRDSGPYRLRVGNGSGRDAVVRLKTPQGRTVLAFFVAANAEAVIDGLPEGRFRTVFASGEDYSRACGVFLDHMQSFILPTTQDIPPTMRNAEGDILLTLPPVGDAPGQARPLPVESYLDP